MSTKKHKEGESLYWTMQLSGWGAFLMIFTVSGYALYGNKYSLINILISYFVITVIGFFLSHYYRYYVKKNNWTTLKLGKLIFRVLLSSLLMAFIWLFVFLPINTLIYDTWELNISGILGLFLNLSIIFIIWLKKVIRWQKPMPILAGLSSMKHGFSF